MEMKWIALMILVAQNTAMVLFMRATLTQEGPRYLASTAVVMSEVTKIAVCVVVLVVEEAQQTNTWGFRGAFRTIHRGIFGKPQESLKMLVPAVLYVVQNNLLFAAVSMLPAAVFQVTYQIKILTTALFSVLLLGKRLTPTKWGALVVLAAGVALVQLHKPGSTRAASSHVTASGGGAGVAGAAGREGVGVAVGAAAGRRLNSLRLSSAYIARAREDMGLMTAEEMVRLVAGNAYKGRHEGRRLLEGAAAGVAGVGGGAVADAAAGAAAAAAASAAGGSAAPSSHQDNIFLGLIIVLMACVTSGFAGVYFELVIKAKGSSPADSSAGGGGGGGSGGGGGGSGKGGRHSSASVSQRPTMGKVKSPNSLWVRNIQLGFFSFFLGMGTVWLKDGLAIVEGGFFQGYRLSTVVVILLQAGGGLLVALVVKYADNILKGFATSVSIVLSSIISSFFFGFEVSGSFVAGTVLVLGAVFLYGMPDGGGGRKWAGSGAVTSVSRSVSSPKV